MVHCLPPLPHTGHCQTQPLGVPWEHHSLPQLWAFIHTLLTGTPSLHLSLRLNPGITSSKKTSSSFPYQNLLHYIVFACLPTQLTTKLYFLSARTRRSSLDPQVQHRTSMKAMSGYVHLNEWQILPNKEWYLKVILMGQPVSSKLTYVIEASSSQITHVVYFYLIFGHAARHARS